MQYFMEEIMNLSDKLNRRTMLKTAAAASMTLMVDDALAAGVSKTIGNAANNQGIQWDEEWDVLVVGSGFAGSAAFCEAIDAGAKTLMIDKMPVLGGNSAINGGAFSIVNSSYQKRDGVKDSVELYMKDIFKAGLNLNDPALVEMIARKGNR